MKFSLPDFAIRRPITVIMLGLTCMGMGGIAALRVPIEFMPPMDLPFLGAFIPYPGASPEQVEKEIAIPAEGEFRTLPSLERMRTNSTEQGCFIGMRFGWGTNMTDALAEVRDRMERLRLALPDDVDRIYVRHFSLDTIPIMQIGLASEGDHAVFSQRVRDEIVPKLNRLSGVAEIQLFGMDEETVSVDLDQHALLSHTMSLYQLITDLRVADVNMGVGEIVDGNRKYQVRAEAKLETAADYENYQVRPGLRLKDVARGALRSRQRDHRFSIDGKDEVFLILTKESDANTAATCQRVIDEIERILEAPGFEDAAYFVFFSQGDVIMGALRGLAKASAYGGAMALVVLFLFLRRLRPTIVVAMAIPGSLVIGLVALYALGMSLNLVTMMSLIIAVGMVVDNAIVVIENIYRHHDLGCDAPTAAKRGAREVGLAIFASTSTTAVVFLPVFYVQSGQMSVFARQFAVPVTISLIASLVIALTVIPLAASRFKYYEHSFMERWRSKQKNDDAKKTFWSRVSPVSWGFPAYSGLLRWTLHQRVVTFALLAALCVFTIAYPVRKVGFQSLPSADRRYVDMRVQLDPNYDIEAAEDFFDAVAAQLETRREELGIKHVFENYGAQGGDMRLYLVNDADLGPGQKFPYTSEEVMNIMWELVPSKFPGGTVHFSTGESSVGGGGFQAQVGVRLHGDDAEELDRHADRLVTLLEAMPGVIEAAKDTERADPELRLKVDPQLAGMAGVNPTVAAQTVGFALMGTKISTIQAGRREIEVWAQFEESDRAGIANLENIRVQGLGERAVPLSEIVTVSRGWTPHTINRRDGKNYVWVNAQTSFTDLKEIRTRIGKTLSGFELPPGFRVEMGDEFKDMEEDQASFRSMLFLALILIYIVMASLFESYVLPLSILTTVPLAFLGVYWVMFLTGTPMDTVAMIGCVLMVGVVVNNGIVIVDRINQLRGQGLDKTEAILRGGRERLRPVLMTAITTILGALPLAIGGRFGDPAAVSLGRAMIGGLLGGTFLTLLIVPLFYSVIDDLRVWSLRFFADLPIASSRGPISRSAP